MVPIVVASIGSASKLGLVVFDGTQGQRVRLVISPVTFTAATISIVAALGKHLVDGHGFLERGDHHRAALPATGSYTILVNPGAYTGPRRCRCAQLAPLT